MTMLYSVFDVRHHGARGDGVSDDTNAIQSAVAAAAAAGGGIVHIPTGNYVLLSTVTIATAGIIVQGVGKGASKIRNLSGDHAFTVSADRCGVVGLQINCESNGLGGVEISAVAGTVVDVEVTDPVAAPILQTGATSGVGAVATTYYKDTRLTSQQVKALAATNIDVVPAPGAGLAVMPVAIVCSLDRNAAYNDAAALGNIILAYKTTQTALITVEADGFLDAAADKVIYQEKAEAVIVPEANTALVLDNDGSEFTGDAGNANTLSVRVYYRIIPTTAGFQ